MAAQDEVYGSLSEAIPPALQRALVPLASASPALGGRMPWPCLSLGWQPEQGAKQGASSQKAAEG